MLAAQDTSLAAIVSNLVICNMTHEGQNFEHKDVFVCRAASIKSLRGLSGTFPHGVTAASHLQNDLW